MLETVYMVMLVSFGVVRTDISGLIFGRTSGENGWRTYAGIVANALSYYRLEGELAFVKHDDELWVDKGGPVLLLVWKWRRSEG
jgi:hypothetical protein